MLHSLHFQKQRQKYKPFRQKYKLFKVHTQCWWHTIKWHNEFLSLFITDFLLFPTSDLPSCLLSSELLARIFRCFPIPLCALSNYFRALVSFNCWGFSSLCIFPHQLTQKFCFYRKVHLGLTWLSVKSRTGWTLNTACVLLVSMSNQVSAEGKMLLSYTTRKMTEKPIYSWEVHIRQKMILQR